MTFNILVGGPGTTSQNRGGRCLDDCAFRPGGRPNGQHLRGPQSAPLLPKHTRPIAFPRPPPLSAPGGCTGGVRDCGKGCLARVPPAVIFIGTEDEGNDRDPIPLDGFSEAVREAFASSTRGRMFPRCGTLRSPEQSAITQKPSTPAARCRGSRRAGRVSWHGRRP